MISACYFLAFVAAACANTKIPSVRLPEYLAIGSVNISDLKYSAHLFLGLPYAFPPVGQLRFEKPVPLPSNYVKTVDATKFPAGCHPIFNVDNGVTDEDCLYLNIMTPTTKRKKLRPVLVFIYGDGFSFGSTREYGWDYFVDNFVSQDLIMVTLQYRLAHFGFFATEDFEINGNLGHFDQLEALKFIKRNIKAFGGCPRQITLAGHDTGSISVHSLSLSPHSIGLYNQEIHLAGSNYAEWAIDNKIVMSHSWDISKAVGCAQSDTALRKHCLKQIPFDAFWDVRIDLNLTSFPFDVIDIYYWTSVYDKDFFAGKTLEQLQQEAPKRNILYGYDAGEGLLWTLGTGENLNAIGRGYIPKNGTTDSRETANPEDIDSFLEQILYARQFTDAKKTEIKEKIFNFYDIKPFESNTSIFYYFDKLTELYSDLITKVPTGKEIKAKLGYGWENQYLFIFNYTRDDDVSVIGNLPGHGYFLSYFAGFITFSDKDSLSYTDPEEFLQGNLTELFVTFVKTGHPSANRTAAPKLTSSDFSYLELNPDATIDNVDLKPKVDFWDGLAAEYKWDFVRGIEL